MSNAQTGAVLEKLRVISYDYFMASKGYKKKKTDLKTGKNGLPLLDGDQDFLKVFEADQNALPEDEAKGVTKKPKKNKHGVNVLDSSSDAKSDHDELQTEDFQTLLDEFSRQKNSAPLKKGDPLTLKKRLKRYPPVEVELDLHGFSAINAQLRVQSFLLTCKKQGFFTVRIIVGKGLHSNEGPVLPDIVEDMVGRMQSQNIVIGHKWDRKKKSRSGSMIIYLKQFDQFE